MTSKYGCHRSPKDVRDYKYAMLRAVRAPPPVLPSSIDYTGTMTGVKNQFDEGTCVAFASTGMKEWQEKKEHAVDYSFSERYVYENAQTEDGIPGPHEGTTIRAAVDVLYKKGVCEESCWPYVVHITGSPCKDADRDAYPFRVASYVALDTIDEMREALVTNGPFVQGIDVYESFEGNNGGNIPMPADGEKLLGGHGICICGYDDAKKAFRFRNSWGRFWGDSGYGWIPYEYIEKYGYDGWTAADLIGDNAPKPKPWYVQWWHWLLRVLRVESYNNMQVHQGMGRDRNGQGQTRQVAGRVQGT